MKINVNQIEFSYNGSQVLNNITTEICSGDLIALVGPNGSGKSTLIKCLNKILQPQKGTVFIDDKHLQYIAPHTLAKQMAYVPQKEYYCNGITVFDTVLTGRKPYINWRPSDQDLDITADILKSLHLESIAMKDISQLSGGQQQMVFIARALAQEPQFLLLDEPTANLDIKHQLEIMELLKQLSDKGLSIIVAIHDINLAVRYANKYMMLKEGQLYAEGGKEIITADHIGTLYQINVKVISENDEFFIVPTGVIPNQ